MTFWTFFVIHAWYKLKLPKKWEILKIPYILPVIILVAWCDLLIQSLLRWIWAVSRARFSEYIKSWGPNQSPISFWQRLGCLQSGKYHRWLQEPSMQQVTEHLHIKAVLTTPGTYKDWILFFTVVGKQKKLSECFILADCSLQWQ